MNDFEVQIDLLVEEIKKAQWVVVFTGAGVSTESGIPDFRSPGGIWERYDPEVITYQNFLSSEENRKIYWQFHSELYNTLKDAKPNAAHYAIAELERMGKLDCVITQNIDNLHQTAGNSPDKVIELHGNALKVRCLKCGAEYNRDEIQASINRGEEVPSCNNCDGLLKPATVLFGQLMPEKETREAFERAKKCDLLITMGSSLVVYPAAYIPMEAVNAKKKLIIINLTATPYDSYADIVIHSRCGNIMEMVIAKLKKAIKPLVN